ncbi:MAG: hypothetical protein DWQ05_07345 [Calditrichaeota bacterium]|nr:MAG: hypothetical protein DWQ05_07345 [Calditrichota bacterium]
MSALRDFSANRPVFTSIILWVLAILLTVGCFTYQDKTGPTYPLEGDFETTDGMVHFKFLRSENIGTGLKIMLTEPVPEGLTGNVKYRRFKSNDDWSFLPMQKGEFEFTRRGRTETVSGFGAELPSLDVRAGKYEFFVYIKTAAGEPVSITGSNPVYARYKGAVPVFALLPHIFIIFISMTFGIRTVFEALIDGNFKWMLWSTIISLILGAFLLGPWVQWYAFGVWWSGFPFGYDWTDNKVLVGMAFWLLAAYLNRGDHRNRWSIYLAGIVTLVVYFIPHSIFGSEFDYRTGTGRGTVG